MYIPTKVTIICLIFSQISRITLKNDRHLFLNVPQKGGYNGIMYSAIFFYEIYAT